MSPIQIEVAVQVLRDDYGIDLNSFSEAELADIMSLLEVAIDCSWC